MCEEEVQRAYVPQCQGLTLGKYLSSQRPDISHRQEQLSPWLGAVVVERL